MFANFCAEAVGLSDLSFETRLTLAERHGFGGLDLANVAIEDRDVVVSLAEDVRRRGLKWGIFWLPLSLEWASAERFDAALALLPSIAANVKAAGCVRTYCHIMPGDNSRPYAENFEWHVHRLKPVAKILGNSGITLGLEMIGPRTLRDSFKHPFIHSLAQITLLADALGPSVGLVIDTFHIYTSGETLESLAHHIRGRTIVNVHVNDATPGRSRDEQLDLERAMPMSGGGVDAVSMLRVIAASGYDGPVIVEPFWPTRTRLATMPPDEAAGEVAASLRSLFAAVADRS